jgi:hypothetical protein
MNGRLVEILIGGVLVGALWCWLQYVAWGGVRYQRRAAWLRPALMRRVLRAARHRRRALDREIQQLLRRAASRPAEWPDQAERGDRAAGGLDRNEPLDPDTLKRQSGPQGPTHRKPGSPR